MKKLFISQPMKNKSKKEILSARERAIETVKKDINEPVELIDSFFENFPNNGENAALWHLGKSLQLLSTADIIFFVKGWEEARGCRIEHICADEYGVMIIE